MNTIYKINNVVHREKISINETYRNLIEPKPINHETKHFTLLRTGVFPVRKCSKKTKAYNSLRYYRGSKRPKQLDRSAVD
jgi:hypothetical protein